MTTNASKKLDIYRNSMRSSTYEQMSKIMELFEIFKFVSIRGASEKLDISYATAQRRMQELKTLGKIRWSDRKKGYYELEDR